MELKESNRKQFLFIYFFLFFYIYMKIRLGLGGPDEFGKKI